MARDWFTTCIYFKPKIHKPGRPIVSACSFSTELILSYLDKVMTPIVKSLPSYIKDSNHALEIFRNFNFSGENKIIFTIDITSLYTVISNNEGLRRSNTFLINVLSKNRARKPYSIQLNWFSLSTAFRLVTTTTNKSTVLQWEPKWDLATPTSSQASSKTNFSPTTTDQNLIFTNATSMTASALLHPAEKNLTYLLTQSILFTRL